MAEIDDRVFSAMNARDPDMDAITGGAIAYSEFEVDMTPKQQEKYRKTLMNTLDVAYRNDPNKGRLGFADWLDNLRPDLVTERARKWEEVRNDKDVMNQIDPKEFSVLEDSGLLQGLLMKHTGRLEDVRDVIGSDIPRPIEEFQVNPVELRI